MQDRLNSLLAKTSVGLSIDEIISKLKESRDLGDSPIGPHWGTHVRKDVVAGAIEILQSIKDGCNHERSNFQD